MAIAVVQHKSTTSGGSTATSLSLAFSSNCGTGNLLIYAAASDQNTALSAATDNNSNTITNAISFNPLAGNIRIDVVANSRSGACTATANVSVAARLHLHIWEVSGLVTSSPVDQTNTGTQAGLSQSISTSGATTVANELVFGLFYDQPNDDSLSAGTGFSPSEFSDGGAGLESALSEVKIVSSTGVQAATASCGVGTSSIIQSIATFKGSAVNPAFEDDSFNPSLNGVLVQQSEPVISVW